MANVRNYEEYRAEVLDRLGDDYTVEDLRNTERWRLRVLDMLSGGGSGGGGESDFSTAEVTFICTGEPEITAPFINIQDDGIYSLVNITQSTQTVTVPLYKNKLSCFAPFSMSVTSTSGNITGSQTDGYIISGNCTINYTLPM